MDKRPPFSARGAAFWLALGIATGAAATLGLRIKDRTSERKEGAPTTTASSEPTTPHEMMPRQPAAVTLPEEEKAALRALIREEVQALRGANPVTADVCPKADPESAKEQAEVAMKRLGPEALENYDEARNLIDEGIQRKSWGSDDRERLRARLRGLPTELQLEVVRPLVIAANKQEVHVDLRGRLF